jgi:predicted MFS family arabinose efflux permease
MMGSSYLRRIYIRLASAIVVIVALGLAANAFFTQMTFERALAPEMVKKVSVSATSTRTLILEAMANNINVSEIYGIEQTFDDLKATMPDISHVALTDVKGTILFQRFTAPSGANQHFRSPKVLALLEQANAPSISERLGEQYMVTVPIIAPSGPVGMLHVGVSVEFVNRIILDMLLDVVVVLVVALFFALELLHFLAGRRIESALNLLGSVMQRGASGDFARSRLRTRGQLFGGIAARLEAVRESVNQRYESLQTLVAAELRGPAHERHPQLDVVCEGMASLATTYKFGDGVTGSELEDDATLARVRAPLFLFILAEELTRPFLPGYVKSLLVKVPWISPEVLVGLPIILFMLIVSLGQPVIGALVQKRGTRNVMLMGAVIAAVGFVASAFANSVLDLLVWRSLCAVGYGFVFVAAQAHVLEYSRPSNRARSFTVFIGAIMVATVCGPSIGGILADNIGERETFAVSALLALGSLLVMRTLPQRQTLKDRSVSAGMPKLAVFAQLLTNLRFMTVTGLAAIPAKMLLTGLCFYLMPLYLLSIGSTQAVAGRVLMTYGVVMVVMTPLAAMLATTRARMEWLVAAGLFVSGLGGLLLHWGHSPLWVSAAVGLVGLGQSLSIAAQSALVREHCPQEVERLGEPVVYGVYRLLERLGNALGPLVAAGLVLAMGYQRSFVAAGAALVVCAFLFVASTRLAAHKSQVAAQPAQPA